MFSRRWFLTTALVLAGTAVCARLGFWQLDRLDQRRSFNAQVESMRRQPALDLNQQAPMDLVGMEWRSVIVAGEYDFTNQVALRNQVLGDQYGYHLITPLLLSDRAAVLVDRGWIPADGNASAADWNKYNKGGEVVLKGQIRLGYSKPAFGGVADPELSPGQTRLEIWNNLDLTRIAAQLPYPIQPVYIQLEMDPGDDEPPIPYQPPLDLTEGPHFGYALQWFTFATILFVGYPFYLRKQEARPA
jgi:surfeit locus 1 family protein